MGGGLRGEVCVWLTVKFAAREVGTCVQYVRVTGLRYLPCGAMRCIFVKMML